jgi:hypothetical protein
MRQMQILWIYRSLHQGRVAQVHVIVRVQIKCEAVVGDIRLRAGQAFRGEGPLLRLDALAQPKRERRGAGAAACRLLRSARSVTPRKIPAPLNDAASQLTMRPYATRSFFGRNGRVGIAGSFPHSLDVKPGAERCPKRGGWPEKKVLLKGGFGQWRSGHTVQRGSFVA